MTTADRRENKDSNRGIQEGQEGEFRKQGCCDKDNLLYSAIRCNNKPLLTRLVIL